MKNKIIITSFLLFCIINVESQTDSLLKKQRHELGADITGLFKQFLNFSEYSFYAPTYYVSYRYHLKKSNLRAGIGGGYWDNQSYPYTINGEETRFNNTSSNLSFRIGYERVSELSKKWQAFYGIDFRPTIVKVNNESEYSNGGYMNGTISSSESYGIAPILGFRFRISNRISLLTETSFSYNIDKSSSQRTYVSLDNGLYPAIPNSKKQSTTNVSAGFSQPVFLILTVDL